jgi:hypothetical protein
MLQALQFVVLSMAKRNHLAQQHLPTAGAHSSWHQTVCGVLIHCPCPPFLLSSLPLPPAPPPSGPVEPQGLQAAWRQPHRQLGAGGAAAAGPG